MPIYRDKDQGCWRFEFNRVIPGRGRVKARKRLPKAWSRAQADAYDQVETARLYGIASGSERPAAGIEQAVELYLAERLPDLKAGQRTAQNLALTYWAFKGRTLAQLPEVCQAIRQRWADELAPATIRNRIRYLTAACRYAFKVHGLCEHDPAARVTVPQVKNERQTYLGRAEMLLLAMTARDCHDTRAMIRIGFYSGMRLGEVLTAEVDTEAWLFKLADTKNDSARWVPIHPRIRSAVKRLPFETPRSTLEKRWRVVRDAVGMHDVHFHDLRHSTASEMINAQVDLYTVGAVLGHKSAQSTKRYAHLATNRLADALASVGKRAA